MIAIFLSTCAFNARAPAADATVVTSEPAQDWNAKFAGKEGWVGGDAVYSVVLGPERVAWLFGDTLIGAVKEGRRAGAVMVNNTVGVQIGRAKDSPIQFVTGPLKEGRPTSLFTPTDGNGWLWPQAAIRAGRSLFIFLPQIQRTKDSGAFGFREVRQVLGEIDNPDDPPQAWRMRQHLVPFASFEPEKKRSWGSALLLDGEHLFIYGYEESKKAIGNKRLIVARAPAAKLADFTSWRFRTSAGWSDMPADAAPLAKGVGAEFSVSRMPGGGGYILVTTENGLSDRIIGMFSDAPEGPWSAPVLLYTCPEMSKDKSVFSYSAKAHAWAAGENELLISYCVNGWEFARLFKDDDVYRPKFIRVKLRPRQ